MAKKYVSRRMTLEKVNKIISPSYEMPVVLRDEESGKDLWWYIDKNDCPEDLSLCSVEDISVETENGKAYIVLTVSRVEYHFFKALNRRTGSIATKIVNSFTDMIVTSIGGNVYREPAQPWIDNLWGKDGYSMCPGR